MPDVYVGVGSNADAERKLQFARAELQRAFGQARCSGVYRSAAVGARAPDYLNMVIAVASDAGPEAVRAELRAIEARAGRARPSPHKALVAIDLDLLLYGLRVDAPRGLPHADILRRGSCWVRSPSWLRISSIRSPASRWSEHGTRSALEARASRASRRRARDERYQPTLRPPSTAII